MPKQEKSSRTVKGKMRATTQAKGGGVLDNVTSEYFFGKIKKGLKRLPKNK